MRNTWWTSIALLLAQACSGGAGSPASTGATGGVGAIASVPATGGSPPAAGGVGALGGSAPAAVGGTAGSSPVGAGGTTFGNSGGQISGAGGTSAAGGLSGSGGTGVAGSSPAGAGGSSGGSAGAGGGSAGASGGSAGASGASAGASGAGGDGPYSPCPTDGTACKILPLGDSITFGLGTSDQSAYRVGLFQKAMADGKHITYVGSLMAGPTTVDGVSFPRNNEGHSGWTIDQIAGIVPSPALSDDPDIILLMIGTNDMYMGSPGTAPQRLASLIDKIIGVSARPLLVVAQITPLASGNMTVETYNAALPAIIDARATAGKHIELVDMYTGFSTSWLADGVHPNAQGNAHMADVWYAAIKDVLR